MFALINLFIILCIAVMATDEMAANKITYTSYINGEKPNDLIVALDRVTTKNMYIVSSQWVDFDDGILSVPQFRGSRFSISSKQYEKIMRKTVIDAVPVGSKSIKINLISGKHRNVPNRRGSRWHLSPSKTQREVFISWKTYKIKALLKDFRKYNIILYLSSHLAHINMYAYIADYVPTLVLSEKQIRGGRSMDLFS